MSTVDVRELRGQIRHWRRGRADTPLVEAFQDAYIAVFATVMLGSMAVNVVLNLRTVAAQACTSATCADARTALPWLFALGVVTACLGVSRLFGPVLVSPATASWLLSSPLDRGALLRPRLLGTGAAAFVAGALLSGAAAVLGGFGATAGAAFTLAVGASCLGLVGLASLGQVSGGSASRLLTWVLASLGWLGTLLLATSRLPDWSPSTVRSGSGWILAAGILGVLALVAVVRSVAVLPRMHRDALTPGGVLAPGLSGALAGLDLALVYDILLDRHWHATGFVRSVRGRFTGAGALVWRDVVRLRRTPQVLVVLAAALVTPYLAVTLGLGRVVVLVAATTGFVAGLGLFTSLRVTSRTPSLVRCLPLEPWATKAACVAVPGALLLVWGLATLPALHDATGVSWGAATADALAVGLTALAAGSRWMTGRPPDYQLPLVTSPMGAVPTSLYVAAARGLDVLLLLTAPLLISPTVHGAEVSLGLGIVVEAVLLARR